MHSSSKTVLVIAFTLGLGILRVVAQDFNNTPPSVNREPPKQDERNIQRQTHRLTKRINPPYEDVSRLNENPPRTSPNIHGVRLIEPRELGVYKSNARRTRGDNDEPAYHNEIMRIARMVGIPDEKVNSSNTIKLLSEIIINLNDTIKFNNEILNNKDLEILDICLSDDKELLDRVKGYHEFLKEISGHKLIKLPKTSNK